MSESNGLPKGWTITKIADVATKVGSGATPRGGKHAYHEEGTPLIRSMNVRLEGFLDKGLVYLDDKQAHQLDNAEVAANDVLLNITGASIGRVTTAPERLDGARVNQHVCIIRLNEALVPQFLSYFLASPIVQARIHHENSGMTRPALTKGQVLSFSVPLAPVNEERRIVAKIEELFSALDAGVAALERAKANLKRYRAAVLKAAVEGRLTEQWRADNPDVEPASKLLERILQERRKKWEEEQLRKYEEKGKQSPKNWKDKYKEPDPVDESTLPALPESWCWASVEQIGHVQLGRQRSPKHHNGPHMRPYLRVANVFEDRIDISDVMEMNFTPNEFETYSLSFGDILLNEGQSMELVGRPAMYRDEVPGACFTNTLVRFRPFDGVDATFSLKVFLAYLKNGRFQKIATITVNIAHLGAGRFSEIEFPVPPAEEQAAIIAVVDHHFSLIDAAELVINNSLARASRLRQSILKRAFEGKLVPQDPTDEPASKLLERIKAERGAATALAGKAKRSKNGKKKRTKTINQNTKH